ncbi:MAG: hypothetical protein PHW04_18195 [Candidatus Wallbacteria bacterium]|nr:hypothetical protein [Candidatus Wallbacteria bacterium]
MIRRNWRYAVYGLCLGFFLGYSIGFMTGESILASIKDGGILGFSLCFLFLAGAVIFQGLDEISADLSQIKETRVSDSKQWTQRQEAQWTAGLVILSLAVVFWGPSWSKRPGKAVQIKKQIESSAGAAVKASYSRFAVNLVSCGNGLVRVYGETDLPDSTLIDLYFTDKPDATRDEGISCKRTGVVRGGQVYYVFNPFPTTEQIFGDFLVQLSFEPERQAPELRAAFEGAILTGEAAVNGKSLVTTYRISLDSNQDLKPVDPSVFALDSPERALTAFFRYWQEKKWEKMVNYTAVSWRQQLTLPAQYLMGQLSQLEIRSMAIKVKDYLDDLNVEITVQVHCISEQVTFDKILRIKVSREFGLWLINPASLKF